ncbi:MAG: hypothetical protein IT429_15805 [Gemmataceae bacterium]|nr:hypothetical protein [Gemmataceae bacterium]
MTVSDLSDVYPVHVAIGSLAVIGYTAFVEAAPRKRQPPREPWYMRE